MRNKAHKLLIKKMATTVTLGVKMPLPEVDPDEYDDYEFEDYEYDNAESLAFEQFFRDYAEQLRER